MDSDEVHGVLRVHPLAYLRGSSESIQKAHGMMDSRFVTLEAQLGFTVKERMNILPRPPTVDSSQTRRGRKGGGNVIV